jgi:hypothetical protein
MALHPARNKRKSLMFVAAAATSAPMVIVTTIYLAHVAPTLPPEIASGLTRLLLAGCAGAGLCAMGAAFGVRRLVRVADFYRRLVTNQAAENGQMLETEARQLELRRKAERLSRAAAT